MSDDILVFETECSAVDPATLRLAAVSGRHRLSGLYEYELTLEASVAGGLDSETIGDLLVQPCRIEVGTAALPPAEIHGVLRRIELLPMTTGDQALYRATLVPPLFRLSLSHGSRIFQEMTWPVVVQKILEEHGIEHELKLTQTYPAHEYTVQYEESDLAFVSRLLEHYGIFYFFEQLPSGARMVITDAAANLTELEGFETIGYAPDANDPSMAEGRVSHLGRVHEVRPAAVDLSDYNWRHPGVAPEGEAPADQASGYGTVHVYGDHFKNPDEGAFLARVRAEELMADREVYRGQTSIPLLVPGHRFTLNGYPSGDLDRDYVVTEVEHSLSQDGEGHVFEKRFTAIPLEVPYRPRRTTKKPRIPGFMHAIVDGEVPGMAAPVDDLGRYKLLLPFDRLAEPGGRASRWVRMAQSSTGANYGMHLPLHIGCEVALMHLGGDPDRPVIVGAVPNADTVSPVTRADATKSRIRSKAGILIELEDDGP